jgi:hypothetical protein
MATQQTNSNPHSLTPYSSLIIPPLRQCTPERLARAVDGLMDGSIEVTVTHCDETEIRALVRNGNGVAYIVVLAAETSTCNCGDATYRTDAACPERPVVCKHQIAVCLSVSHKARQPAPQFPMKHLKWSNGQTVCHADPSEPSWQYPWTLGMTQWAECCASCSRILKLGSKEYWGAREKQAARAETIARRAGGGFARMGSTQRPNLKTTTGGAA